MADLEVRLKEPELEASHFACPSDIPHNHHCVKKEEEDVLDAAKGCVSLKAIIAVRAELGPMSDTSDVLYLRHRGTLSNHSQKLISKLLSLDGLSGWKCIICCMLKWICEVGSADLKAAEEFLKTLDQLIVKKSTCQSKSSSRWNWLA